MLNPPPPVREGMAIPDAFRLFIGVAELLAAAGLLLPGLTRRMPVLTPLAAGGLMIVMIGAVVYHLTRGETMSALFTAGLFALVTFVAYMRWRVVPLLRPLAEPSSDV
ncbi:MAG: DoxX family protein [bacterium]